MSNRRHSSSSQQQTGDLASRNVYMKARRKVTPYAIPLHHQRSNLQEQDQRHINMEGESRPLEKKLEGKKQDGTSGSWFKVTIPFGIKYDEKWLMNLIQSHCSIPFTPVEFHYEKMQAHFFVVDASIAYELKSINDKILDDNNDKISIFVSPSDAPHSVQKELTSEKAEKIMLTQHKLCSHNQLTMNKQYDASQQILDRQILPFDRGCTVPSLNIHEENMTKHLSSNPSQYKPYELFGLPDTMLVASNIEILDVYKNEVESEGEMIKRKELGPGQICADRSSLHTTMPDKSRNINSILELFPKLLCLDGQGSLKPTICDTETCKTLPTGKGSFFGSEMLKNLVLQFLQQYYMIYDYGDRQSLLSTYHDEACFSLTVNFSSIESSLSSLCEYYKYSRNIKTLSDSYVRRQLLKHKKHNIVDSLCALPKTQHDFTSFIVDMCFQTETMLCFSVNGVFKELEGRSHGYIRAFNRTFITTISSSSSLCIINDKLFIKDAQRTSSAFISIDTPSPSSSYVPTLSLEHQGLVQSFYIQSRTDLHRSQKKKI
uniref:nuclear RNA export factor 3 n=1 Tax=Jaculus jaculus TaxID=51337 RepID=UPI001E1B204F|nr:nuclear RNA export factor 3 [Jaculus jaculus]